MGGLRDQKVRYKRRSAFGKSAKKKTKKIFSPEHFLLHSKNIQKYILRQWQFLWSEIPPKKILSGVRSRLCGGNFPLPDSWHQRASRWRPISQRQPVISKICEKLSKKGPCFPSSCCFFFASEENNIHLIILKRLNEVD